jgi:Domain of Unknown Function (DUF1206)
LIRTVTTPSSVVEALARAGFLAKGVLYVTIGVLAIRVAAGMGGRITSSEGALVSLLRQPFGSTLLLIATVGLFGYAAWRVLQGVLDSDRLGLGFTGLALRASFLVRGAAHAALAWQALRLYRGLRLSHADRDTRLVAGLFEWPLGDWVLVLIGVGVLAFTVYELYSAATGRLPRDIEIVRLRQHAGQWAVGVSRFGIAARALVLGVLGWFILRAGLARDASEVAGTAQAIRALAGMPPPFGRWLLLAIAVGFVAYGFYQLIHARYLRIRRTI